MSHANASERDNLFRAVLDAPEDEAVRLVYADWLEESGDPLGEFIRIQCRMERLQPWDPEYFGLDLRARELLRLHREEWERPVADLGPRDALARIDWRWGLFRRGLPENVMLTPQAFLEHHERLFDRAPVTGLCLAYYERLPPELFSCPGLSRLCSLRISPPGSDVQRIDLLSGLAACPHLAGLRRLSVAWNRGTAAAVAALVRSSNLAGLESLSLELATMDEPRLAALADGLRLSRMRELAVGGGVTPGGLGRLMRSRWLRQLTRLSLVGRLGRSDAAAVALAGCPAVRRLVSLRLAVLRANGVRALASSPHLSGLRELDLSCGAFGTAGAEVLATATGLGGLRSLALRECGIGPRGAAALFRSRRLAGLTRLDLSNNLNAIDADALHALSESPLAENLCDLDLGLASHSAGDARRLAGGVRWPLLSRLRIVRGSAASLLALVESPSLPALRSLEGVCTSGDSELVQGLAASSAAARFRELSLVVGLTDGDAAALARSPNLERIGHLRLNAGDAITAKGRRLLARRFGRRVEVW